MEAIPSPPEFLPDNRLRPAGSPRALEGLAPAQAWRASEPSFSSLAWTIAEERWVVAGVACFCLALALAYLFLATPIYRANALLQVEEKAKSVAGLEELAAVLGDKPPAETEIEIIRSRTLMGAVVDLLDLDVEIEPRRFPLVGAAVARRYRGAVPAAPVLGLSRFAWGGERIRVQRLEVSEDLLDHAMTLTALEGGRYRLVTDGQLALQGEVGVATRGASGGSTVELFVSELVASPGTEFTLRKRTRAAMIAALQRELQVTETGKKTGILVVELQGADRQRVAATVSAIATTYLRQNVERTSAEAAKTLEFLESQLPLLKSNLDAAEAKLNAFKSGKRTVDLSREATALLERSAELEKEVSALQLQRTELRQRFTDNHPNLVALAQKIENLRSERGAVNARLRALPETEADAARLVRDVKVAGELYLPLLNKAQELRVAKAGILGNVRILDQAQVPQGPSSPAPALVLTLGLLLGLGGGVAAAIGRRALDQGTCDAEQIEAGTGLPVYATIPHSRRQAVLARSARRARSVSPPVLFAVAPEDAAIESLRSLRTSLEFALLEAHNNVVAVLGPAPEVGKSFVGVNLAHVLAAAGKSVLVVDADLRRGRLHRRFGMTRQPGLSDVISGSVAFDAAVRSVPGGRMFLLPTGTLPPNPAEVLSSRRFELTLGAAARRFNLVIVDTPPLLAVTDAALVARLASVNLLVLRAGQHSIREISLTLKRLAQAGIEVQGAVLNDLTRSRGPQGRYYYAYEYSSAPEE